MTLSHEVKKQALTSGRASGGEKRALKVMIKLGSTIDLVE